MSKRHRTIIELGTIVGRLTVIGGPESIIVGKVKRSGYQCKCVCGTVVLVRSDYLLSKKCSSCGCQSRPIGEVNKTHGLYKHPLYGVWLSMRKRCGYPGAGNYAYYGGRGIRVCPEWDQDFMSFYCWSLANGYCEGLELGRCDHDGDYTPDNCVWQPSGKGAEQRRSSLESHPPGG